MQIYPDLLKTGPTISLTLSHKGDRMVRRFVVCLPPEEYRRLKELADREERIIEQQASYLLRQVLAAGADRSSRLLQEPGRATG